MNSPTFSKDRRGALLFAIPALATVLAVLHHPTLQVGANSTQEQIAHGLQAVSAVNAGFHIGVMLLIGMQAVGLFSLAEAIGPASLWVRAGLFFYGVGTVLVISAASIDGFALAFLAQRLDVGHLSDSPTFLAELASQSAVIQGFTRGGLLAQGVAMLCWSVAAIFNHRSLRGAATLGCLAALALLAMLVSDAAPIGPKQLTMLTLLVAVWSVGAAACLWLRRFSR